MKFLIPNFLLLALTLFTTSLFGQDDISINGVVLIDGHAIQILDVQVNSFSDGESAGTAVGRYVPGELKFEKVIWDTIPWSSVDSIYILISSLTEHDYHHAEGCYSEDMIWGFPIEPSILESDYFTITIENLYLDKHYNYSMKYPKIYGMSDFSPCSFLVYKSISPGSSPYKSELYPMVSYDEWDKWQF